MDIHLQLIWPQMKICTALSFLIVFSLELNAREKRDPDFYLIGNHCITTGARVDGASDKVISMEGTPTTMICWRAGKSVKCDVVRDEKATDIVSASYEVSLESQSLMTLTNYQNGEFFMINRSANAAALVSKSIKESVLMNKTCHMSFLTESEYRALVASSKKD